MILISVAALVALVLALLGGVVHIDFLKKKMYKQYVLEDAPQTHQVKNGTPTTGGVFLVGAAIIASIIALLMAQKTSTQSFIILITLLFYTLAGFKDDIRKIKGQKNQGLTAKGKLFFQFAIAFLPVFYVFLTGHDSLTYGNWELHLGWLYLPFCVFLITGTSNAVNLTDGLDGLAGTNVAIALFAFTVMLAMAGYTDIAIISAAVMGATIGFLYFNHYPAKVFMGDTGSLALGGFLGTIAVMGHLELWLLLIGVVFFIETVSVMLQVFSYKTFGKRIFKMSPIHHHFELLGWKEVKVVRVFSFVTFLCSIIAIILFNLIRV